MKKITVWTVNLDALIYSTSRYAKTFQISALYGKSIRNKRGYRNVIPWLVPQLIGLRPTSFPQCFAGPKNVFSSSKSGFEFRIDVWNLLSIWFENDAKISVLGITKRIRPNSKHLPVFPSSKLWFFLSVSSRWYGKISFFSGSPLRTDWHSKASNPFREHTIRIRRPSAHRKRPPHPDPPFRERQECRCRRWLEVPEKWNRWTHDFYCSWFHSCQVRL